jgi:hypothetical protein
VANQFFLTSCLAEKIFLDGSRREGLPGLPLAKFQPTIFVTAIEPESNGSLALFDVISRLGKSEFHYPTFEPITLPQVQESSQLWAKPRKQRVKWLKIIA